MAQQFADLIYGHSLLDEIQAEGSPQIMEAGISYAKPANFLFELMGYIVLPV